MKITFISTSYGTEELWFIFMHIRTKDHIIRCYYPYPNAILNRWQCNLMQHLQYMHDDIRFEKNQPVYNVIHVPCNTHARTHAHTHILDSVGCPAKTRHTRTGR